MRRRDLTWKVDPSAASITVVELREKEGLPVSDEVDPIMTLVEAELLAMETESFEPDLD